MKPGYFAKLQCIDDQTHVAMSRKPHTMRLEGGLVPVASAPRMAAHIQNSWQPSASFESSGSIQIRRHIQSWPALVVEHIDDVIASVQRARDGGMQWRSFRHRPQPQHVEILLPEAWPHLIPLLGRFD